MRRKRLILGAAAAGLTAVALLLGGVFRAPRRAAEPRRGAARARRGVAAARPGSPPGDTAAQIARLQATLRRARTTSGRSTRSASRTSSARARPATRPTTRSPTRCCTARSRLAPRDLIATSGLGSLALSRHRFGEALALGRRARAISPTTARNYGVIGDALVELGRYRERLSRPSTRWPRMQPRRLLVLAHRARARAARRRSPARRAR